MRPARIIIALLIALSASLFVGIMVGTAGGALYTPLYRAAAPVLCDGDFLIESQSYSYKPGQSGVAHTIYCRDRATGALEEMTTKAVLTATLVYATLALPACLLLTLLFSRRWLRGGTAAAAPNLAGGAWQAPAQGQAGAHTVFVYNGRTYASPDEMPAEARAAYEKMSNVFADADGDGVPDMFENLGAAFAQPAAHVRDARSPEERLSKLKSLRDAGLISEQEYEAKRAEILSGL